MTDSSVPVLLTVNTATLAEADKLIRTGVSWIDPAWQVIAAMSRMNPDNLRERLPKSMFMVWDQ
jgi:hypothetical protein